MDQAEAPKMYILINKTLGLTPGKICAQAGHGIQDIVTIMLNKKYRKKWKAFTSTGSTKITLKVQTEEQLLDILQETEELTKACVVDEGRTQCPSGSLTAVVYAPLYPHEVPRLIKDLKLY